MALAIDGSTPALASTATAASVTTASFTPPSGSVLVALLGADSPTAGNDTSFTSVSNTGTALTWTRRARKNKNASSDGGAGTDGGAEIWTAYNATSQSITVTATGASSGTSWDKTLQVMVLTGADQTQLTHIITASSTSGLPSATLTSCQAGSYVFAASSDWAAGGNGTAGTAQTIISEYHVATQVSTHNWRTTNTLSSAGSQTMNLTLPSAQNYNLCVIEVVATSSAGPVQGPLPFPPFTAPFIAPMGQPLQLMGDTSGAAVTQITLTDTATGTDALTVTATVPLADLGTGADALTLSATVPLADTGAGTDDSLTITATVNLNDTGSGTDQLTVNITDYGYVASPLPFPPFGPPFTVPTAKPVQLAGSTDTAAATNPQLSDTGTGTDSNLTVTATVPLSDTGAGSDALTVSATTPLPGDTGTGADSLTVNATVPLADTGTGADTMSATATVPLADVGAFTEGFTVTVTLTVTDTATGVDVMTHQVVGAFTPSPARTYRVPAVTHTFTVPAVVHTFTVAAVVHGYVIPVTVRVYVIPAQSRTYKA